MNKPDQPAPNWVTNNSFITRLLNRFITICDRPNAVRFSEKISANKWPELFDFSDENHEFLWRLVEQTLYREHQIVENIRYRKNTSVEQHYDQATIYFNREKEDLVRAWLARPKVDSYTIQWQTAVDRYPQFKSTSLAQNIQVEGLSAERIISSFHEAGELINKYYEDKLEISMRGLSARCFWGDSKFLDKRYEVIYETFPKALKVVLDRPIMMSAYVPGTIDDAIFVENLDSFLTLVDALQQSPRKHSTAVIYSAGYLSTANRIRTSGQSQFLYVNSVSQAAIHQFQDWWYRATEQQVRCVFWGDLDFEGLSILRVLRNNFPLVTAWVDAYEVMIKYHLRGLGHSRHQANKEKQQKPEISGCDYADNVLLPLLLNSEHFIDQEVIDKVQLLEILLE